MKLTKEDKINTFKQELDCIQSEAIRNFAEKAIETLPDYFFSIPASSTGKYHPAFSLGEGGLVRHVRAVARIMIEMFRMEMFNHFTSDEKDLLIVAILLHDGAKSGIPQTNYTVAEHPLVIADYLNNNPDLHGIITEEQLEVLLGGIRSHMGQWNKDYHGKEILPKPKTRFQNMVHLADYLGSRKSIEMNFDAKVDRE